MPDNPPPSPDAKAIPTAAQAGGGMSNHCWHEVWVGWKWYINQIPVKCCHCSLGVQQKIIRPDGHGNCVLFSVGTQMFWNRGDLFLTGAFGLIPIPECTGDAKRD